MDDGTQQRAEQVAAGLAEVRARVEAARIAAGRADRVTVVVVTKTFPSTDVDILAGLGVVDVGENRDREARAKRAACGAPAAALRWHMIGQVQRNKASSVARWADVVESVDRAEIAAALGRGAAAAGRTIEVLLQVALDPVIRPERGGVDPAEAMVLAERVAAEPALALMGVMGVAPFPGDPAAAFARLGRVSAALRERWPAADRVSAGMSGDLEEAIAHGATQVRIGGAVLGPRSVVQ